LSGGRQNLLIDSAALFVKTIISEEIKNAKFFSVSMDTTFDLSKKEQLCFVVRYVDSQAGVVHERLIGLKECPNTKSETLFEKFQAVCKENDLNWLLYLVAQAYDGAANMQGRDGGGGLQKLILERNPAAIFIWCYAHRLNLVLTDCVSCCPDIVYVLGILEGLYDFFSSSKNRIDVLDRQQKAMYGKVVRRLKRVETTRWWSHFLALSTFLLIFDALCFSLEAIAKSGSLEKDWKAAHQAQSYLDSILTDRFLLTALTLKKLFSVIDTLSKMFQKVDIDLLTVVEVIPEKIREIENLRTDEAFKQIQEELTEFKKKIKLNTTTIKPLTNPTRLRRVPKNFDEEATDEPITDLVQKFKVDTLYRAIDVTLTQLKERFGGVSEGIYKDIALFSRKRITEVSENSQSLPKDAFQVFCNTYSRFINREHLIREYLEFCKVFPQVEKTAKLPEYLHGGAARDDFPFLEANAESGEELDDGFDVHSDTSDLDEPDDFEESLEDPDIIRESPGDPDAIEEFLEDPDTIEEYPGEPTVFKNTASTLGILRLMIASGMTSAFPTLFTALKIAVTIPTSSATPERSFNKVKITKTRLRTTMVESRLESLLILSCENDIKIDPDKVIANIAMKSGSDVVKKMVQC